MPTNIGTSALRMPQSHRATNINAVVISPQKATRPVFLGFIFLRSFSDSTLIKSGRNSTNTAHNAIIPATNKITITASKFQFEYHSTTTANVTLPSSLCLRRREPPWRRVIWRDTARPMPEPLLVISIWMRSSASIFCGISFRFLLQIYPHKFSKFSSRKVNLHHCYYSLPRILFNSSIVRVVSYTGTMPIVSSISFK